MRIVTISYKKIFAIAAFLNETIGVEVQVDEGEDIDDAMRHAKNKVESWQSEKIYSPEPVVTNIIQTDKAHIDEEYGKVKDQITHYQYRENAEEYLSHYPEYINVFELKSIIKNKPSKNGESNY